MAVSLICFRSLWLQVSFVPLPLRWTLCFLCGQERRDIWASLILIPEVWITLQSCINIHCHWLMPPFLHCLRPTFLFDNLSVKTRNWSALSPCTTNLWMIFTNCQVSARQSPTLPPKDKILFDMLTVLPGCDSKQTILIKMNDRMPDWEAVSAVLF